jgi:hypothetical protein
MKRDVNAGSLRLSFPHVPQRGRRDNDAIPKASCYIERNECFPHSDFIGQNRSPEFLY